MLFRSATLEEFYTLYETNVQESISTFPDPPKVADAPIKDGPPCLQALCSQGIPEGGRNNTLFNIGIYVKKVYPGKWEDQLVEHNLKYVSPPLPNNEVQLLIKQVNKKDYHYKCKDAPLNSFCNSGLCRTRKFGIGANGPDAPQIASLSKYASDPPLWFLDVNGRRLELEALAGTVVRLGRQLGVPTPLNFAVYAALLPWAGGAPAAPAQADAAG